jgi:hypothetical protein
MWKQLLDFGNRLFTLTRKTEQHEEDIKALRQDIKEIRQELRVIAETLQEVRFEQQRERENAETQRELQRLRLENILYRFERRLPPGNPQDETPE